MLTGRRARVYHAVESMRGIFGGEQFAGESAMTTVQEMRPPEERDLHRRGKTAPAEAEGDGGADCEEAADGEADEARRPVRASLNRRGRPAPSVLPRRVAWRQNGAPPDGDNEGLRRDATARAFSGGSADV